MSDVRISEAAIRQTAAADGVTHISVGVAVTKNGRILAIRRAPDDYPGGMFELPGGGVNRMNRLAMQCAAKYKKRRACR